MNYNLEWRVYVINENTMDHGSWLLLWFDLMQLTRHLQLSYESNITLIFTPSTSRYLLIIKQCSVLVQVQNISLPPVLDRSYFLLVV